MLPKEYSELLSILKEKIRYSRSITVLTVNSQMLAVYWEIGNTLDDLINAGGYGSKTIDRVAADLSAEFPEMKGLRRRSLHYMREFAKAYPDFPKVQRGAALLENGSQQAVALIPWAHHQVILDKVKTPSERLFYIKKSVEQGWSRNVLALQIESRLYEREGKSITNFTNTLPKIDSDLAQETFKNPYLLDFLDIGEEIRERDLENGLIHHLAKFMLELGRGFSYVGNQHKINIENDEFYLDLLFFNYKMNCFVIFELKIGDFKPEFAGKLNFYINAVDAQLKEKYHHRTIGVLLCKTPNETMVRFALQGVEKPIAVSDFKLVKALPKSFKKEMPTVEELERELEEETRKLRSPTEKRFDILKKKIVAVTTSRH